MVSLELAIMIAAAIVSVSMLVLTLYLFYRRKNPKRGAVKDGKSGEGRAVSQMRSFARVNSFRLLAPARLENKGKTADLDAVVAGHFGVLGVKELPFNGEVYGAANEKEWVRVDANGERTVFANPFTEAAADARVLRSLFTDAKLKQVPIEVVCVFTGQTVQLALPRSTGHHTLQSFKSLLKKEKYMEDNNVSPDNVYTALQSALRGE